MNKQEVYRFLQSKGIKMEMTEHKAVYNMAELAQVDIPYPNADAKNLFVRDDKKQNYYLLTVKGDKRVDLKAFRKVQQTRPLSFASEQELQSLLGLLPGSVTPLGLLNDESRRVKLFLDLDFWQQPGLIGVHPNENTATVWLKVQDLVDIIQEHGNEVSVVRFDP